MIFERQMYYLLLGKTGKNSPDLICKSIEHQYFS